MWLCEGPQHRPGQRRSRFHAGAHHTSLPSEGPVQAGGNAVCAGGPAAESAAASAAAQGCSQQQQHAAAGGELSWVSWLHQQPSSQQACWQRAGLATAQAHASADISDAWVRAAAGRQPSNDTHNCSTVLSLRLMVCWTFCCGEWGAVGQRRRRTPSTPSNGSLAPVQHKQS